MAAAEDIVTMKVLAGRLKDLEDVASILRARSVDSDRVRSTLRLLEQALDRRDLVDESERLLRQVGRQNASRQ